AGCSGRASRDTGHGLKDTVFTLLLIFPLFVNRCRHRGNVKRNSSHFARGILLSWLCIIAAYGGPLDDWTTRDSGVSADLYGIAHGNNTFVVVGDRGTILTSSDGIS